MYLGFKRYAPGLLVAVQRGLLPLVAQRRGTSGGVTIGSSSPPDMTLVPICTLEWQRADSRAAMENQIASAKAAMEVQRDSAKVTLDSLRTTMAQNVSHIAALEALSATHHAAMDAQKKEYKDLQLSSTLALANAKHDADLASGRISARGLMEASIEDIWKEWENRPRPEVGPFHKPPTQTQQLCSLLSFPGVSAYLQVTEEDNNLPSGVLTQSAPAMYEALCMDSSGHSLLPAQAFAGIGKNGFIAFAALLAISGRNVGLYCPPEDRQQCIIGCAK